MSGKTFSVMRFSRRDLMLLDLAMRELLYLCEEGHVQDLLMECDMDVTHKPTVEEVATLFLRIKRANASTVARRR